MTKCPTLQDACSNHFNEDDPIILLFEKTAVAVNYLRDAGLSEASCMTYNRVPEENSNNITANYYTHSALWRHLLASQVNNWTCDAASGCSTTPIRCTMPLLIAC